MNLQTGNEQAVYCYLPQNERRSYDIQVLPDRVLFRGKFWYLKDYDFYRCKTENDMAYIRDFIGMGYLAKRSYRKGVAFVFGGAVLMLIKALLDKLSEWTEKANDYLKWIHRAVTLPEWLDYMMYGVAAVCLILAVLYFFSKKKVIEISFLTKRICVPEKSMTPQEFAYLRQTILRLRTPVSQP